MQAISSEDFWQQAAALGVGIDPDYPDSGCLCLLPPAAHARFWVVPPDPARWPHFTASLLHGLDEWATGLLWPRSGVWPLSRSDSAGAGVRDVILRGAGIPDGWAGAVRVERAERDSLVAAVFAVMVFGWHSGHDLFFLPDHARQLLQTDHHDAIHAECRSGERVAELVAHMAAAGYNLPAEVPDETFKRPAWMDRPA